MDDDGEANLPPEMADRFTEPFARFLKVKAATGGMLLLAACAALIVSNSAWSTPFLTFWDQPLPAALDQRGTDNAIFPRGCPRTQALIFPETIA